MISRLPPGTMEAVPLAMPPLENAYSYVIAKLGPIMARTNTTFPQKATLFSLFCTARENHSS